MEPIVSGLSATRSPLPTWRAIATGKLLPESRLGPAVLHTLLTQLPVGVLVTDRRGRIIYENELARCILGGTFSLVDRVTTDHPAYVGLHPDGSPYQKMEWPMARALLLGETVREEEMDFISPDGVRRRLLVSASPVHVAPGRIDAAVVICTDVTELRCTERWRPIIESLQTL